MPELDRVLIVGGGIAGLTLARALHRNGLAVELVERSAAWRAEGGGIAVQANAMRILRALGLDAAVEQQGAVLHRWLFCDQQGEVPSENDLEKLWRDVGPCIGIERMCLQRILVAGVEGTLTLGAIAPTYTGAMAWRSVAPIRPHIVVSSRRGLFLRTLPGRRWPHLWLCQRDHAAHSRADSRPAQSPASPLRRFRCDRSPMMGQDGCMAMEDACVLAQCLCSGVSV